MKKNISQTAEELLVLLKKDRKKFQSTGSLAYQLQVNLESLSEALAELKSWGYKLKEVRGKGVRLEGIPDLLLSTELKDGLKTKILGNQIYTFQSLGSTNEVAFRLAEAGAPEGTTVVAERQTSGRGRLSRKWYSPAGLGIWLSLVLRPQIPLASVPALSLCASLACLRTAQELTAKAPFIKWPNDAYLNGKKFSGVLTELSAELDRVKFVVLGIGININHSIRDFPSPLRKIATSLGLEAKRKISRVLFAQNFLEHFEEIYLGYKTSGLEKFKSEIMRQFYLLNQKVTVQVGEKKLTGKAVDIDPYGALILETKYGLRTITAGDVTIV